jgi:hypothetical protein
MTLLSDITENTPIDHDIVLRPYDFGRGDDRAVDLERALVLARERARISQRLQQVREVSGPLLGQTQWLVQGTGIIVDHLRTFIGKEA